METPDNTPIKLNPFAVAMGIHGKASDIKNIKRLKNGSIVIEYTKRQQQANLLSVENTASVYPFGVAKALKD